MSQIASFYTIDKNLSEALLKAAVPQRRILEKKILFFTRKIEQTVNDYWNFIKTHATAQANFGYRGTGLTDLELLLEEKGINLYQFGSGEFARKLSAAQPSVVAVFDQLAAQNTIKMLSEIRISKAEAQEYYRANFPKEDEGIGADAILSAYDIVRSWLGSVGESQLGLLTIG